MMHHRHYTIDEANAKLDLVGRIVRRVRDAHRRLIAEGFNAEFVSLAELSGGAYPGPEHASAALQVALGFDQLEELDIVVRDLERGLVDFPAVIDGREVYLCWLVDEPQITHWHSVESGFAGRKPLAD